MKINGKKVSFINYIIDKMLNILEKNKSLTDGNQNSHGHIELAKLSDDEREKAFRRFSEGSEELYQLLKVAYDNGIESVFCCKGHSDTDMGYVSFKVTDQNVEKLKLIGKALSHNGILTNFDNRYNLGKRVTFRAFRTNNKKWFEEVTKLIINPPMHDVIPEIYYHGEIPEKPEGRRFKDKLIDKLREMRYKNNEKSESKNAKNVILNKDDKLKKYVIDSFSGCNNTSKENEDNQKNIKENNNREER